MTYYDTSGILPEAYPSTAKRETWTILKFIFSLCLFDVFTNLFYHVNNIMFMFFMHPYYRSIVCILYDGLGFIKLFNVFLLVLWR
jgi:O-antigen/teichoic acid export membrane protein